jgi:hypothetical protein
MMVTQQFHHMMGKLVKKMLRGPHITLSELIKKISLLFFKKWVEEKTNILS